MPTLRFYIIIFFFTTCFLTACKNKVSEVAILTEKSKLPAESSTNVEIIHTDSARIKLKLTSPEVNRYVGKEPYVELPKGVLMEFYDSQGNVKTKLTSGYAIRNETQKTMEAKQKVVVVNEKGEQLNTEHLVWNEETHTISTKEFVTITTAEEVIYGDGLESNEDFSKYKILNIKGTIALKDSTLN